MTRDRSNIGHGRRHCVGGSTASFVDSFVVAEGEPIGRVFEDFFDAFYAALTSRLPGFRRPCSSIATDTTLARRVAH